MVDETEKKPEEEAIAYPNIVERFAEVFQKLGIKKSAGYVDHCAKGDLENLEDVEERLYQMGLHPSLRHQVVIFWAGEIKQPVPIKLQKRLSDARGVKGREEADEAEKDAEKYSVDTESGAIRLASTAERRALTWDEAQNLSSTVKKELAEKGKAKAPTYVYDTDTGQVRMAKEGELGGTLDQAKELKKMGEDVKKEDVESPFIQDGEGKWTLNPKAKITGAEFMALEAIKRARESGEAVDPLEQLAQTAEKMRVYREAFGGGDRGMPDWMSDPAKFIEMVRTISGGGKGDEAVVREVAELRQTIDTMKEEKFISMIVSQQHQIQSSLEEVRKLGTRVEELGRPVTGRTELDIMHEVATTGLGLAQTELGGLRRDIKEVLGSSVLPATKTPDQREGRKQVYHKSLAKDTKIENLGRSLFFGEDIVVNPPSPEEKTEAKDGYVYDTDTKQVRPAKEGEVGRTLEQAKDSEEMQKKVENLLYE